MDIEALKHENEDLKRKVEEQQYSRFPVFKESLDTITGVLHAKDLIPHLDEKDDFNWRTLVRPAFFIHEQMLVEDLLKEFQSKRIHFAIVVDEFGGTDGIITMEDILEEIVGEIADEYDKAAPEVEELPDGGYRVVSRMNIDDFANLVDVDIDSEEEGVDSVIGLMAKKLGRVPIAQSTIEVDGWTLTAELGSSRRNRIGFVLARPTEPDVEVEQVQEQLQEQSENVEE